MKPVRIYDLKNLTEEELAVVMAKCARSPEPFDEIAKTVTEEGASQFHDKYVLGYGHASVAEIAVPNFAFEGVSILASKILESMPRAAYQEKSTRAQNFLFKDDEGKYTAYLIPSLLTGEDRAFYVSAMEALFSAYETILPKLQEHIFKQMGTDKFVAQKRAFDAARYLLPIGTQTNLGMRINARDLATLITKLLSSHVTEFQQLGVTLKAIAVEQLPTLVRHADANAFLSAMKEIAEDFAEEAARGSIEKESQNRCTIVECPHSHPAIMSVARAFLGHYGRHSDASFSTEAVNSKAMKLIDAVMDRRGEHDPFPDEFDVVPLTVEMVMDYGAYRDLQRHRYCTQFPQWPTIDLGYEIPEDITAVGLGDQYCEVMANAAVAVEMMQDRLEGAHPDIHLYMIPLAFRHRMLVQMSLKQAAYMIELRTRPQGHISYRRVAAELHDGLAVRMAPLAKWIRCNDVPRALDQ